MRRPARNAAPASALACLFAGAATLASLGGCQQFFTTSLAAPLARKELPAPVLKDEATVLANLDALTSNKEVAAGALSSLAALAALPGASSELKTAAVQVALAATGAGEAIASALATPAVKDALAGGDISAIGADLLGAVLGSLTLEGEGLSAVLALAADDAVSLPAEQLIQAGAMLALSEVASELPAGTTLAEATPAEIAAITANFQAAADSGDSNKQASLELFEKGAAALAASGDQSLLGGLLVGFLGLSGGTP